MNCGLDTIEICHAFQSADHVGHMRAEHATIGVGFINDDEAQIGQEIQPVRVMRQDPGVKHIGVAQHDARILADGGAGRLRSITVVDRGR